MVVTRKECGDNMIGREASRNLRLTIRHVHGVHAVGSEFAGFANSRPEEGSVFRRVVQARGLYVGRNHLFEVVPHGDLARLASLLLEVEHPLIAGMIKTGAAEFGHGAGASGRAWMS